MGAKKILEHIVHEKKIKAQQGKCARKKKLRHSKARVKKKIKHSRLSVREKKFAHSRVSAKQDNGTAR